MDEHFCRFANPEAGPVDRSEPPNLDGESASNGSRPRRRLPDASPLDGHRERRTKQVVVHLTPTEFTFLSERADSVGLPRAVFARDVLLTAHKIASRGLPLTERALEEVRRLSAIAKEMRDISTVRRLEAAGSELLRLVQHLIDHHASVADPPRE